MEIIFKKRNPSDATKWDRFLVTSKTNIDSVDFCNPPADKRVKLEPINLPLYLLDYLKFGFSTSSNTLSIKMVKDAVNQLDKHILDDVYAVEFIYLFSDPWLLSIFHEDVKADNYVAFVALLTKKDTGKDLPGTKFPKDRPIGISDSDWKELVSELYLDK